MTIEPQFSALGPILVLGDVGVDRYTYGTVERISPEAPVPVLRMAERWDRPGLSANVFDNLRSLGIRANLYGICGNDEAAFRLKELLKERGAETLGLIPIEGRPTTVKERIMTKAQQICRVDHEETAPITKPTEEALIKKNVEP